MIHFIRNPFRFEGIVTGDEFCDRKSDIDALLQYMYSGNNIVISMKRRVGKSSLIKEIFENHIDKKQLISGYVDIYGITSARELYLSLKDEVENIIGLSAKLDNAKERIKNAFGGANVFIEVAESPKVKIEFNGNDYPLLIKKLFLSLQKYAKENNLHFVFAIDEFQKIAYLSKNETSEIETNLRTSMQESKRISFVLSGSNQTMLDEMFQENRPLYRQGAHYPLDPIDKEVFFKWVAKKFKKKEITISKEAFFHIYKLSGGEAKIVQQICFELFAKMQELAHIEVEDVCAVVDKIYKNNSEISAKFNMLKLNEQKMLKVIALEEGSGVTVSPLLLEFNINNGSVSNILKKMVKDYIIVKRNSRYEIIDSELKLWILVSKQEVYC
jgi:AAA+ ATPase superfamily predicted ATPase